MCCSALLLWNGIYICLIKQLYIIVSSVLATALCVCCVILNMLGSDFTLRSLFYVVMLLQFWGSFQMRVYDAVWTYCLIFVYVVFLAPNQQYLMINQTALQLACTFPKKLILFENPAYWDDPNIFDESSMFTNLSLTGLCNNNLLISRTLFVYLCCVIYW